MSTLTQIEDRFLREPEVHRLTGLSRTTRWRLERAGKFPRRRRISENAVAYPCRLAIDYDLAEGRFKATDYRMPHEK